MNTFFKGAAVGIATLTMTTLTMTMTTLTMTTLASAQDMSTMVGKWPSSY